jgi:KipI family sensor histidine kinase inhibitor
MPGVKAAGDSALLLELEETVDPAVNARAVAMAAAVRRQAIRGVRDVVSTYRSVALYFDPLVVDVAVVRDALEQAQGARVQPAAGRAIRVPIVYGGEAGPDLAEVAAYARLSPQQVIARHADEEYRVFMLGFLPGFAYMGTVRREIAMPRRPTPRLRVPGGSVGIAGAQTAVYPRDSPGGWQIIGRTPLRVFDASRTPPSIFAPGDSVRFVPEEIRLKPDSADVTRKSNSMPVESGFSRTRGRTVTVLRPGLFTTVQDCGRWGHQSSGVPVSGAMDALSHRLANRLVGNGGDAATLEVTLVGPELRMDADTIVAVTGANLSATHDGAALPLAVPVRFRGGSILRFGARRSGTRAYVAFDGGVAVPAVLGSRATHSVSGLGGLDGRCIAAGDCLWLGLHEGPPVRRRVDSDPVGMKERRQGVPGDRKERRQGVPGDREERRQGVPGDSEGGARVRIMRGPQDDFFPETAFDVLQRSRFRVTPQSDRMGYRLDGARIPRLLDREMISDATFTGAIQVPASGEPILLMADRQTTGGYPQIATVITADLPLAAQLAPGDWIEFEVCTRSDALAALAAQEGVLARVSR